MTLLSLRNLTVEFAIGGAWPWSASRSLQAVRGISLDLAAGETLGIVGESGSGKSTLARAIIGTIPRTAGSMLWDGVELTAANGIQMRRQRREMQMVFQDPLAALNPRMTVGEIIAEPLRTHHPELASRERRVLVQEMMERVGLLPNLANRYPHEFSGGQCQRIGIARALVIAPRLLICDEPVSALDVSVQAQVINLLERLQREMKLAMIFIAHDLSVVKHVSNRIAVMYLGTMVEIAGASELVRAPQHPYTRALIEAIPVPDPQAMRRHRRHHILEGELPSPMAPPSGCVFRTRCQLAQPACAQEVPVMQRAGPDHHVWCPVVVAADQENGVCGAAWAG